MTTPRPTSEITRIHPDQTLITAQWERQPTDTPNRWAAFQVYRDMGEKRSLQKVADEVRKHPTLIRRWSAEGEWRARIHAWEAEEDREAQEQLRHGRRAVRSKHLTVWRAVQGKALARLSAMDPNEMNPSQLLDYIKAALAGEARLYGISVDEDEVLHGTRIVLDPRMFPAGAQLPDTPV